MLVKIPLYESMNTLMAGHGVCAHAQLADDGDALIINFHDASLDFEALAKRYVDFLDQRYGIRATIAFSAKENGIAHISECFYSARRTLQFRTLLAAKRAERAEHPTNKAIPDYPREIELQHEDALRKGPWSVRCTAESLRQRNFEQRQLDPMMAQCFMIPLSIRDPRKRKLRLGFAIG